jgi:esterase/lipase superfamily enzyme
VDLTHLDTSDPLGHGKFAEAPEIVRAIGSRLSEGQTLSDSQPGIGSRVGLAAGGAGAAVETVVGGAVEAPFAVVDPRAREDLSDRFEQVGARAPDGGQ